MKLLLVEDDAATIEAIKMCVAVYEPSSTIVSTSSALDAVSLLTRESFDSVILDLGLPDADGFEVLRRIKELGNTPVLVCSARHSSESIDAARQLGADDYVIKPFDFHALLDSLRKAIGHRSN